MKKLFTYLLIITFAMLFKECAFQKRLYRKGYYIESFNTRNTSNHHSQPILAPKNISPSMKKIVSDEFKIKNINIEDTITLMAYKEAKVLNTFNYHEKIPYSKHIQKTNIEQDTIIINKSIKKEPSEIYFKIAKITAEVMLILIALQIPYLLSIMFEPFQFLFTPFLIAFNSVVAWLLFILFWASIIYHFYIKRKINKSKSDDEYLKKAKNISCLIALGYLLWFLIVVILTIYFVAI